MDGELTMLDVRNKKGMEESCKTVEDAYRRGWRVAAAVPGIEYEHGLFREPVATTRCIFVIWEKVDK